MELLWFILTLLIAGLIVGGLARLILPGREAIGVLATAMLGIAGSFLGGFVGRLLFGSLEWWTHLLFAIVGAALLIAPFGVRRRRTVTY